MDRVISNFEKIETTEQLIDKLQSVSNIYYSVDDVRLSKEIDELIEKIKTNKRGSLHTEKIRKDIYDNIISIESSLKLGTNLTSLKDSGYSKG